MKYSPILATIAAVSLTPRCTSFPVLANSATRKRLVTIVCASSEDNYFGALKRVSETVKGKVRKFTGKDEYEFGDLSRWVDARIKERVNTLTEKDEYQFGDLSRWVDARIKDRVNTVTEKDEYEFGDLSRWIDARVKERVNKLTGKSSYSVGDLTKAVAIRVVSRRYVLDDLVLLLKAMLSLGVSLSSVASFLPVRILIDLLNYSIAADVGDRLVAALAIEVDKRMKEALTGDPEYQLGDLTKRAVLRFTGKESYTFGDIARTVVANMNLEDENQSGNVVAACVATEASASTSANIKGLNSSGREHGSRNQGVTKVMFGAAHTTTMDETMTVDALQHQDLESVLDPFIVMELERWDAVYEEKRRKEAQRAAAAPTEDTKQI